MRYRDDDQPGRDAAEPEFAAARRKAPKWVVSRTLGSAGLTDLLSEAPR